MTEEEYFRKNYPDYCCGNRLLSPYWDFFQDGVEFDERQSEKKIEELGQENERLKNRNAELKGMYAHSAREAGTYKQFFERERKENEKLTKENRLLGERCNQLLKDKGELTDKIEKMKCCQNCKSEDNDYIEKPCCECSRCLGDIKREGVSDKWELQELAE